MSRALISCSLLAILLTTSLVAVAQDETKASKGWPSWRGPNRDGISDETGLLQEWTEDGPPIDWRIEGLGGGYSSIAVSGGKIFTLGSRRRSTELIALDAKDGKELWSTRVGSGSPNCTPTVDGDLVFALGRSGDLICVETATGKEVWRKNYGKDFGGRMMSGWGYSESPLVDGDNLICTPGANDGMIAALNKKTGELVWKAAQPNDIGRKGQDGAAYSSVIISNGAGVKQYLQLTGRGVISVAAKDGKFLWGYNRIANGTANIPTPIASGDYVFCSSGYNTGAALLKLSAGDDGTVSAEEVYFLGAREMQNHHGGMILIGDHIYCGHGHNKGFPLCIEMKTGKVAWRPGRGPGSGSAAIVYADKHLYFRYQNGTMVLIEATPDEYVLKGSFKIASNKGNSWPHPVIAGGRLYLRDQGNLLCYNIAKQ